jgi:nicotinamide riboside kinase
MERAGSETAQKSKIGMGRGMKNIRKIVILGPESTGKSTLCAQLAEHYNTVWCPEYAREYLLEIKRPYTYDDLLHIAQSQLALEDKYTSMVLERSAMSTSRSPFTIDHSPSSPPLLFIDTDMNVMKIWCEVVYSNCHSWILKQAATRQYDLHLLCNVDLPWVKDELREYPDLEFRMKLFKMYKDLLVNSHYRWDIISGTDTERLQSAISIIDRELVNNPQ